MQFAGRLAGRDICDVAAIAGALELAVMAEPHSADAEGESGSRLPPDSYARYALHALGPLPSALERRINHICPIGAVASTNGGSAAQIRR